MGTRVLNCKMLSKFWGHTQNQEYDLLLLPPDSVARSVPHSKIPYFHSSNQEQTSQDSEKNASYINAVRLDFSLNANQGQFSPDTNRFPHFWETLYIFTLRGNSQSVTMAHTEAAHRPHWTSRAHANTLLSSKQTLIRLPHYSGKTNL